MSDGANRDAAVPAGAMDSTASARCAGPDRCHCACGSAGGDVAPAALAAHAAARIQPFDRRAPSMASESLFSIPKMDCPSEERLVRMALQGQPGVSELCFDLARRELRVRHAGPVDALAERLGRLGLGSRLLSSAEHASPIEVGDPAPSAGADQDERRVLVWVLGINALMFVIEAVAGWLGQSTGLLADSLDMLADATVYGLALHAVGRGEADKLRAARLSGAFQLLLALGVIGDVLRRLYFGSEPEPPIIMLTAALALVANLACLRLLSRHRQGGVHMRASWIFSTNDVLANLGVILAGAAVALSGSHAPDLIAGAAIGLLVLSGALRILRMRP